MDMKKIQNHLDYLLSQAYETNKLFFFSTASKDFMTQGKGHNQ